MKSDKKYNITFGIMIVLFIIIIIIAGALAIGLGIIEINLGKTNNFNEINDIKIRYAYHTNLGTAELLNSLNKNEYYKDILEINLKGEELEQIATLIKNEKFEKVKGIALTVLDVYEVSINDKIKLYIQPEETDYAYYKEGENGYLVKISEKFVNEIDSIVQREVDKYIKQLEGESVKITL